MSDLQFSNDTATSERHVATVYQDRAVSGPAFPTILARDEVKVFQLPPSYEYGQDSPGIWSELMTDEKADVGDVLRITYKLKLPFLQTWQSDFIVSRLNADPRFELRHVALNEELHRLTVEVKVIKPFSPALLIPLAIAAVLAGALIWVTTLSIERLGTVKVGDFKVNFTGIVVVGGLILAAMSIWPRVKNA